MEIKNKALMKMIEKANCREVLYRVTEYENDENLSEYGFVLEQVEWTVEDFEDDGHCLGEELSEARSLLWETDYGKRIPIDIARGFRPKIGYDPQTIQRAKDTVNEYNRTKRLYQRLLNKADELNS